MTPEIQIQREIDIERLCVRLRGMTYEQLLRFGKAARYMVSSDANMGKSPLQAFVIQLAGAYVVVTGRRQSELDRAKRLLDTAEVASSSLVVPAIKRSVVLTATDSYLEKWLRATKDRETTLGGGEGRAIDDRARE